MDMKKKITFITLEKLMEMNTNGERFKLVEVLDANSYKEGHIPGAINIPTDQLQKLAPKMLKKTEKIITYCASYTCHASTNAAAILLKMGYKNVYDFKGSKKLWTDAGFELER